MTETFKNQDELQEQNLNVGENPANETENNKVATEENSMCAVFTVQSLLKATGVLNKRDGFTPELLGDIFSRSNGSGGVHPRFKIEFLLSDLIAAGYKLAFDDENRDINASQVKELYDDVLSRPGKTFSESAKIVSARTLLEEGKSLSDIKGNKLTFDTPDIDTYLVVLDGQHRSMVATLHPNIGLWMEYIELVGLSSSQYYVVLNNRRKNHSGADQKHMIKQKYSGKVSLLDEMEQFKKAFAVTDKFAEGILTGKVDQFKKSELAKIQNGDKVVDDKFALNKDLAGTAWAIMNVAYTKYASNTDQWKVLKKYQFPVAIWNVYNGKIEDEQNTFKMDFCNFIKNAPQTALDRINENIGDKEKLTAVLTKELTKFLKAQTEEEKDKRDKEVIDILKVCKSARSVQPATNPNAKVKSLSSGTFANLLDNMQAVAKQKAEFEKKKAENAKKKTGGIVSNPTEKSEEPEMIS